MKIWYWLFFLVSIAFYGCDFKPFKQQEKVDGIILNTAEMKEYPTKLSDSTINVLNVVAVYPSDQKKPNISDTPNVDVFLLRLFAKPNTDLNDADTVAVFDSALKGSIGDINLDVYTADVAANPKFKKCKISIPQKALDKIRKYKYQYGKVTMVADD
jgi:hypothetical protein